MSDPPENAARILVVDDAETIRSFLRAILERKGYEVLLAADGNEALDRALESSPDLVILDLFLPGMTGLEVCRQLRSWSAVPILFLSVSEREDAKIQALDMGADDYCTKPVNAGELLARIRALLRRSAGTNGAAPLIRVGDLEIDVARRRITRGEQGIRLTRTEFEILACLARKPGGVFTAGSICASVWERDDESEHQSLRVHMAHLRRKIEPDPARPQYLHTCPGVGYSLEYREAECGAGMAKVAGVK